MACSQCYIHVYQMHIGDRRSNMEIIRQILRTDGGGLAHLRNAAYLSSTQVIRYLEFLERSGVVVLERRGSQIAGFKTTELGRAVLKLLEELIPALGYESLPEVSVNIRYF